MTEIEEGAMGYKKIGKNLSFADLAVSKSLEKNRSLKMMEKINKVVKWRNIEALLLEHYEVGTSKEGADAFPPLLLMKCMLLQKWFHIPSVTCHPKNRQRDHINARENLYNRNY
jgi:transposase, IS5 family